MVFPHHYTTRYDFIIKRFYFYFKSKDDLASAVTEYYQKILLEQFQNSSQGNDWESFIEEIFDFDI